MKKTKLLRMIIAIVMVVSILPTGVLAAKNLEFTVGDSSGESYVVPFSPYSNYSASQYMINYYEFDRGQIITDLTWYYVFERNTTRQLEIYMHTDDNIQSLNAFVPINILTVNAVKVFDGSVDLVSGGTYDNPSELHIEFDQEFVYERGSMVVTVIDKTGDFIRYCSFLGYPNDIDYNYAVSFTSDTEEITFDNLTSKTAKTHEFIPMTTFGYKDIYYTLSIYEDRGTKAYIPQPGQYSVVIVDYEDEDEYKRFKDVRIIPVTITEETVGDIEPIYTNMKLNSGDKVMLLSDTGKITPVCAEIVAQFESEW